MSEASRPEGEWELELSLASHLENIRAVRWLVTAACDWSGAAEKARYEIELAAIEAVTNAIRHAHSFEADKKVRVRIRRIEGGLEIRIEDEGDSIPDQEWARASAGAQARAAENAQEGGRGLFLIQELMDEARYDAVPGGNRWVLVKRF